jgi:hypothetical protein
MAGKELLIPPERIEKAILLIRGQKVMLDSDLARLYGVATKVPKLMTPPPEPQRGHFGFRPPQQSRDSLTRKR